MKKITKYFFEGLIFLLPAAATVYLIYIIFMEIDGWFNFKYPGLGFVITILLIIFAGMLTSNFIARGAAGIIDKLFGHIPFIKLIYNSIKDLIEAFVGEKKKFNKPVLVSLTGDREVEVLGFVTEENLEHFGIADKVAVYLPQSYNFAGNLIIVPKKNVTIINVSVKDVMTFIISGGLSASK